MGQGDSNIQNPVPDTQEDIGAFNGDQQADPAKLLADSQVGQPAVNDQIVTSDAGDAAGGNADVTVRIENVGAVMAGHRNEEGSWADRCAKESPEHFASLMDTLNNFRRTCGELASAGIGPAFTADLDKPLQTPQEAIAFLNGMNTAIRGATQGA